MAISLGLQRFVDDILHHRERFRQALGFVFVILVSIVGTPKKPLFVAGVVLVLVGIAVRMWASGHIKKNKVLATDGPYAYVRHPLYVGNLTAGVGFALASSLWWSLPLYIVMILLFYPHAIRTEDDKMHRHFKGDWEDWKKNTRALIPRLSPGRRGQAGGWSFRQSLRKNGEPVIAVFLLFLLYYMSLRLP